ncbi:hypothetical protein [Paenibacillus sp. S150]|uniref:hypothetical protein n=1 Tax=Paenibacillus sp. S150 TaxID=2749826 RepID=UPI001C583CEA|nr:hypothetical protein [Paenibacillus sp. S150]MBW4081298.1 hypothetical protein [Paenibacillus sp. S150]
MFVMDIWVYKEYRKHGKLPPYAYSSGKLLKSFLQIPVLTVSAAVMDGAIALEDLDLLRTHRNHPVILTDRRRVLVVDTSGYSYARYVYSIDVETAQTILSRV